MIRRKWCLPIVGPALLLATLQAQTTEETAEMRRTYREQALPGPEHEMLSRMAGSWDIKIRMWSEPGAEPTEQGGSAESRMILGGRFLQTESRAPGSDEPISLGLIGFDRRTQEFHSIGMDVSGTYWVSAKGRASGKGQPIVMSGEDYNPSLDHLQLYDFVLDWVDADTFLWSVIFKDDIHTRGGDPFKMVEVTYNRRKSID